MFARPDRSLRWDVLELHLEEAVFLWTQREAALGSAGHTLAEVAEGPERRLLAHVDALAVAGARCARRLLVPALSADEPETRGAAALALASPGEGKDVSAVAAAAAVTEQGAGRLALLRALGLSGAAEAPAALAPLLRAEDPGLVADALDALSFCRALAPGDVAPLLSRRDARVQAAAIRALRHVAGGAQAGAVRLALGSDDPEVRLAAILTGTFGGDRAGFDVARREVGASSALGGAARLLVASLGGDADVASLAGLLSDARLRREALFALGFSGRTSAVEACLEWLDDEAVGAVAAEAFSAITGIAGEGPLALRPRPQAPEEELPPLEEDLATSLMTGPDDDLPLADPDAVHRRWKELRPRLPGGRLLRGRPFDLEALVEELRSAPTRRRAPLALELAARSKGVVQVETLALSATQVAQLDAARALRSGAAFTSPWP